MNDIKNALYIYIYFRDNPNVDIIGCNLYERYLKDTWKNQRTGSRNNSVSRSLPKCRSIPRDVNLYEQTITSVESLLVETGVYNPEKEPASAQERVYHGHRDIEYEPELAKPSKIVADVEKGIRYILEKENMTVNI